MLRFAFKSLLIVPLVGVLSLLVAAVVLIAGIARLGAAAPAADLDRFIS